jgi:hypothetical protein
MLRPRAFNIIDEIQRLTQSGTQFSPISMMNQIERQRESITGGASRQPISALNPQGDRRVTQYPGDPVMPKMSTMPAGSPMRESMYLQPEQRTQPGIDEASLYASAMQEAPVQEVPATPTEEPSLYDKTLGDEEWRLRKALALNSMRLNPDAGFAAAVNSRLENLQATRLASSQRNKTADALEQYDAELARAVRNGLDPKTAVSLLRDKKKGVVVGKMVVNPTTGDIIYDGTSQDSEAPATFRALQMRAEEAGLIPGTEPYKQFMINGGQRTGLSIKTNPDGTFEITEGGVTTTSKLTDSQSNALTFGGRMQASGQILNSQEQQGTKLFESIVQGIPIAGNYLLSPEYQSYSQAKRDFINAVLRKESGAAIAASEFDNADKQYFPQPGDSQQVIEQKRANRELATKLMMSGVPIKGLTEDPRVILQNASQNIAKPAGVSQQIWDAMTDEEKLAFK